MSKLTRSIFPNYRILFVFGFLIAGLLSGCGSLRPRQSALVSALAVPVASPEASLATLPDEHPFLAWVLSDSGRFTDAKIVKFFAAREAFWNHDTEHAVKLLRELSQADIMSPEHFHELMLQCYERSGRWADTLPLFAEFGIEESH